MEISAEHLHTLALFLGTCAITFTTTFLRGFQNKNVAGGYKKMAFVFGFLMYIGDVLAIGLAVSSGLYVAVFAALGAGLGWVVSMTAHERLVKSREKEKDRKKKLKKLNKREEWIRSIIQEELQERDTNDKVY